MGANRHPAEHRLEIRGGARALEARHPVAPVHDAGVRRRSEHRRVAQAGRQVVGDDRELLRLGGDDPVAGQQRAGEARDDQVGVGLLVGPGGAHPEQGDERERGELENPGTGEPRGGDEQERPERDGEVAARPRRRELREAPGDERCEQRQGEDRGQSRAPGVRAAQQRHHAGPGHEQEQDGCRLSPEETLDPVA